MATNEFPASQIDNQNHNINNIPLYAESKMTRQQAIHEIGDIILRSNMKPRLVKYTLQLLKKLLPSDNTLPNTIDELFRAMMSSENDWRLTQYFIRHKECPSILSASSNMCNENSNRSINLDSSLSTEQQDEYNISIQSSSSSSDDENPYEKLQKYLRPITDIARDFNLNYTTTLPININQRLQLASNSINPSKFLDEFNRLISETTSTVSTNEQDLFDTTRIFDDTDNDTLHYSISNDNKKLCCFEINGYDVLNGGKRCQYY
ncbi:unnamed protein product [Rotaria sordida]|uniref:Uncharacterized protein n=2 Tax=Rotaria sordida TaxID=392033 RepID=A0A814K0Y4_9BILA|nr:unnamed protein product [Rotaria sordida]